eukprot:352249-Chlamydomonas_euryale.AAC.1
MAYGFHEATAAQGAAAGAGARVHEARERPWQYQPARGGVHGAAALPRRAAAPRGARHVRRAWVQDAAAAGGTALRSVVQERAPLPVLQPQSA